eukprot:1229479-Amphidinium_carterae.1
MTHDCKLTGDTSYRRASQLRVHESEIIKIGGCDNQQETNETTRFPVGKDKKVEIWFYKLDLMPTQKGKYDNKTISGRHATVLERLSLDDRPLSGALRVVCSECMLCCFQCARAKCPLQNFTLLPNTETVYSRPPPAHFLFMLGQLVGGLLTRYVVRLKLDPSHQDHNTPRTCFAL